jgi:DNA-binding NtrC family response regulator
VSEGAWPQSGSASGSDEIVGKSAAISQALASAKRLAASDAAVLIAGERGSGKELFARIIHHASARRNNSFVKVNCVTTARGLLERKLFGFGKGAFDETIYDKIGGLERADNGTLFLNEITSFPLELQPRLVRVLKRGETERLGDPSIIHVNVRLIAATRHDPEKLAGDRLDQVLYDQFKRSSIQIPPLRERREDIPLLAHYFMRKFAQRMNKGVETIAPEITETLQSHDWPGNVTQLEHFIQRSVILTHGSALHAPLDEL